MSDILTERRVSPKAFMGHYTVAIAVGIGVATLGFITGSWWLSPVGILPVLGVAAWAWVSRAGASYRLYADRLEIETGLLGRKIENVELFRIRDIGLQQGLFGRLGNYGDISIHSNDASSPAIQLRGIDAPRDFYKELRERVGDRRMLNRTVLLESDGTT